MPSRFRRLLNHDRHARSPLLQGRVRTVPREGPAPVQTDFIMRIEHIFRAKLVPEDFSAILRDRDREVLTSLGPVSVTNPKRIRAAARDLEILIQSRTLFVSTRRRGVPFTLA